MRWRLFLVVVLALLVSLFYFEFAFLAQDTHKTDHPNPQVIPPPPAPTFTPSTPTPEISEQTQPTPTPTPKPPPEWTQCEQKFGYGMLQAWDSKGAQLCTPGVKATSELTCRMTIIPDIPIPTQPHTICDGHEIYVDFSRFSPANAPLHRSGYYLGGPGELFHYGQGAFSGTCKIEGGRLPETNFPRVSTPHSKSDITTPPVFKPQDHLRDIFTSFTSHPAGAAPPAARVIEHPMLLVTREGNEHKNVFHTMTDWLNAYIALYMTHTAPADVQLLLLDAHPDSPLDPLWQALFSQKGPILRAAAMPKQEYLLRRAVFSPPGYSSFFFAYLYSTNACPERLALLQDFASWALKTLNIERPAHTVPVVTVSVRRLYGDRATLNRQWGDEAALVEALRAGVPKAQIKHNPRAHTNPHKRKAQIKRFLPTHPSRTHGRAPGRFVDFGQRIIFMFCSSLPTHPPTRTAQVVDFGRLTIREQIATAAGTDVLVGVHGAGLTHLLWMGPQGGLVEVHPKEGVWRCFENLALWTGLQYHRVMAHGERHIATGTAVDVNPSEIVSAVVSMTGRIQATLEKSR
ncbi:putative protein O-GlcNAc transferase [Paratrimastix pyriformis]|uniref:EGF domain-specific O-linked N-acetylglucosamine transferase n=1 Tax=Paratrimastix pyriformis TaxID=342808 RepID=A0ABQ8UJJ5_9EUKA|nr:putative protein O-GlcNAc transferase [Paratrimastix pyriformis]